MNSLERVLAAVTGNKPDYIPVSLTLSLYGARLIDCSLKDYYTNPRFYADGQIAVKKTFDTDILFTPFVLTAIAEAFGGKIKYYEKSPPNMQIPGIKEAKDILNIDLDQIEKHPRMQYLQEASARLCESQAKETAVAAVFLSPPDLLPLLLGIDKWLETVLFEEPLALKIMERMSELFVKTVNNFFKTGVHFVALPVVFCNPMIITKRIIDQVILPVLKNAFHQVNGPLVLHHGGAPMNDFIGSLNHLPKVAAFAIDQMDQFEVARKYIDPEKLILGNIDGPTLNKKNVERIQKECIRILNNRKEDNRFIFLTSGADVPYDTPPENIHAVINTVKNFKEEG